MKNQTRIALVFFSLTISVMIMLSAAVYYFAMQYTFADFYKRLKTRAQLAARIKLEDERTSLSAYQEMRDRILEKLPNEIDYFIEVKSDFNATLADTLGLPASFFRNVIEQGAAEYRRDEIFYSGIRHQQEGRSYIVIVSAESYYYSHHVANLRTIMTAAFVLISLIVLYVSFLFSRYVFGPVRQITRQAGDINSDNLHVRLDVEGVNDDIKELKVTFNTMLDRLEASFATQNNFISNASHELATPLTAIIGESEVALSKERNEMEYRDSLKRISHQAERLERITKSLLFLAQTGFEGSKQKFRSVRVDQLLWDVKSTIEQMNPKSQVMINIELMPENPDLLTINGSEQLLHLALSNIVSNGCKYSNHQPVEIFVGISDTHVIVVVTDRGIGIPENEIRFIYDPFFRASNTIDFEGYGIGLPLTRNIVRIHKGTISVKSKLGYGTVVELSFPVGR
ncbi:sensor histidine kinase [Pseudochryseolinea flava]|uniref:histidine kinase n=1 Tax=Pseudochryseolinea flava TaxID=2059302 RepID=A0A364Y1Z5_9BACT|nr:ATP-binding protein [Pseudochryseolinea flava]RAW00660.1 two-component sensor histidine kinase [Pseudochryseolinea flava]